LNSYETGASWGGEKLKAAGLAERCRVIEGSFFENIPAGADACLFVTSFHDWTDATNSPSRSSATTAK
jgi:hypothetical protein